MENKKRNKLHKLLTGKLSSSAKQELLYSKPVERIMHQQWETASQENAFEFEPTRTYTKIQKRINQQLVAPFYKVYSIVASILILLGIGSAIYMRNKLQPAQMYVVASGIRNIESISLPDGSEVQLGPGSSLTYPAKFTKKRRCITLKGQAFFSVAKDKQHPFIVHTQQMDVQALGTAFEVFSHAEESYIETTLLNGKVRISWDDKTQPTFILHPNEQFIYNKQDREGKIRPIEADKYTAWRQQGFLSFEKEPLAMILPRLEHWYGRKIICDKALAQRYYFSFKVRDESIERILHIMSLSAPLKFKLNKITHNYELTHK